MLPKFIKRSSTRQLKCNLVHVNVTIKPTTKRHMTSYMTSGDTKREKRKKCLFESLISKIGLDRATHCCDEPVLKPIGGHLEKTTQSSVFVSKSYFEASEIDLECSQCFFRQIQT